MPPNKYRIPAGDAVPRQSERTASENKERAYIAASRRSDRSLDARVISAKNASDIHKRRTGKALKVTEEIVRKEEMYEEEDDLPARYHAMLNNPLSFFNQGSSQGGSLQQRHEAYTVVQMGTREALAARISNEEPSTRHEEVNRRFADSFPGFMKDNPHTMTFDQRIVASNPSPRSPFTPTTPSQGMMSGPSAPQPELTHMSPENVTFNSHFGNSASQGNSPISALPTTPGVSLPPPTLAPNSKTQARQMSQPQVDPALSHTPWNLPQFQQPRQPRSYDEAFSNPQSPLTTSSFPATCTMDPRLYSPGMVPQIGPSSPYTTSTFPATYQAGIQICSPSMPSRTGSSTPYPGPSVAQNTNTQRRRATAHSIMPSGGLRSMPAAGLTTQLPPNIAPLLSPTNVAQSASLSGVPFPGSFQGGIFQGSPMPGMAYAGVPLPGAQQGSYPTLHPGPMATQGPNIVSHTTQAPFQLQGNLCQMQREKKHKRTQSCFEAGNEPRAVRVARTAAGKPKAKAKAKDVAKPRPRLSVVKVEPAGSVTVPTGPTTVPANNQETKNVSSEDMATSSQEQQYQAEVTQPAVENQPDFNIGSEFNMSPSYNMKFEIDLEVDGLKNFYPDLGSFNLDVDDTFMNDFFKFPASQPENENSQAV